MPLPVAPNLNLSKINSLDANKLYFLSSTTGEIKEAGFWMRLKCKLGFSSVQQKINNLVDAVRSTLLDSSGAKRDAALDSEINSINRTKMVKGSVLQDIAKRFSAANTTKIEKYSAERLVMTQSLHLAVRITSQKHFGIGKDEDVSKIINHALKPFLAKERPMREDGKGGMELDQSKFLESLNATMASIEKLLEAVIDEIDTKALEEKTKAGGVGPSGGKIDTHYASHIIDTFFNDDGTLKDDRDINDDDQLQELVNELKPRNQVYAEVAFKNAKASLEVLKNNSINPEAKVASVLKLAGDDEELKMMLIDKMPQICVNGKNELRSDAEIKKIVDSIKANLKEIHSIENTKASGTSYVLTHALANMGSATFPEGMLKEISDAVDACKFKNLGTLTSLSTPEEICQGMEELRKAVKSVDAKIGGIANRLSNAGMDAVDAQVKAVKSIAIAMVITKLGPAFKARLPGILNSSAFQEMASTNNTFLNLLQKNDEDARIIAKDEKQRQELINVINDQTATFDLLRDVLNIKREKPIQKPEIQHIDIQFNDTATNMLNILKSTNGI